MFKKLKIDDNLKLLIIAVGGYFGYLFISKEIAKKKSEIAGYDAAKEAVKNTKNEGNGQPRIPYLTTLSKTIYDNIRQPIQDELDLVDDLNSCANELEVKTLSGIYMKNYNKSLLSEVKKALAFALFSNPTFKALKPIVQKNLS